MITWNTCVRNAKKSIDINMEKSLYTINIEDLNLWNGLDKKLDILER